MTTPTDKIRNQPVPSLDDVVRALARQSHFGGDAAASETVRAWTDKYDEDHASNDDDPDDDNDATDKHNTSAGTTNTYSANIGADKTAPTKTAPSTKR